MKKTLAMKLAVPAAIAVMGVLGASPIGAQSPPTTTVEPEVAVLTVTKTVEGVAPTDAVFTLHITCTGSDNEDVQTQQTDYDEDTTFPSTGGNTQFVFTGPAHCDITEIDDGGATSNSGPVSVDITQPISYSAEIVNTFAATPTTAAAAAAVEATAAFTG